MNTDEPEPDAMDAVRLFFWIVAGLTLVFLTVIDIDPHGAPD